MDLNLKEVSLAVVLHAARDRADYLEGLADYYRDTDFIEASEALQKDIDAIRLACAELGGG